MRGNGSITDESVHFVSSIEEMTDLTMKYVLEGYIYEAKTTVIEGETISPDLFEPTEIESADFLNKRMSGTTGSVGDSDGSFVTDFIEIPDNFADIESFMVRLNREAILTGQSKVVFFNGTTRVGANILKSDTNTTIFNGETISDIRIQGDSTSILPTDWTKVTFVKLQYQLSVSALEWADIKDCKVTFDVYNTTTENTTRTEFVNTGEVYAPIVSTATVIGNAIDITGLKTDVEGLKTDVEALENTATNSQSNAIWYAIGDSITDGLYVGRDKCWVAHVLRFNGYDAEKSKNLGISGIGFVRPDPTNNQTIRNVVDGNIFSAVDLVTIAVGINDWQQSCTIDAVKAEMLYCFEKILTDNPYCKIYFITPFNKNRGAKESNWALGFEQNGITLETFVEEQISVCEANGVEVIDMTHNSVINRLNLTSVLLDNTHPTELCHLALGRELARKIMFA